MLTHSHWDHVFGAAELGVPVVAHARTAEYLDEHAQLDWSDEALEQRLAAGEVSQFHVDNVRQELPAPREVRVAPADVVFDDSLTFELGDVTVRVQHVANDHTDDGCVAVRRARSRPVRRRRDLRLAGRRLDHGAGLSAARRPCSELGAEHVVEGTTRRSMNRAEFEELAGKIRRAGTLAGAPRPRRGGDPGELGEAPTTRTPMDIVRAFVAGAPGVDPDASRV